jgi:hypothetical protein
MTSTAADPELRAKVLLKGIRRHNAGGTKMTEFEMRSVLKEVQAIVALSAAEALSGDVLRRVDRVLKQAVEEAGSVIEKTILDDALLRAN